MLVLVHSQLGEIGEIPHPSMSNRNYYCISELTMINWSWVKSITESRSYCHRHHSLFHE